jgi:hypothetical protein
MINRWSPGVLVVLVVLTMGLLAGYTAAASATQTQTETLPFAVGDTVTLGYLKDASQPSFGTSFECAVTEIRGVYVKCGPRRLAGGISDRGERWLSLRYVVEITKPER